MGRKSAGDGEESDEFESHGDSNLPIKPLGDSAPLAPVIPADSTPNNESSGCCTGCIWTRQLTSELNKEAFIRITLIELLIYVLYLIVCCIIVYGTISPKAYYYTKVLSDLFLDTPFVNQTTKTFRTSADVKDFWTFAESSMLNALYWEDWYDDPELQKPVDVKDQGILYENRIIGRPRLRQIRVTSTSCPIGQAFGNIDKVCYHDYDSSYEETQAYSSLGGTAWNPNPKANTTQVSQGYWGQLEFYKGSGAYILLGLRRSDTEPLVVDLKNNLWITRATRVVFLELTVYNANLNLFCAVRLAWEFPVTGGLVTSWTFRTFRLFEYISPFDYFIFACQIIFILFTLYYTIQEIVEVFFLGIRAYLTDVWSYLDLLILTLSYLCIGFTIYKTALVANYIQPLLSNPNEFADFTSLAFWNSQFVNTIAILLFFCWIKIFKYISFNRTMSQLSATLSRCSTDILGFGIMFFIVFLAFSQLGYLLFGSQVRSFSSMYESSFTLLRLLLGDFDFRQIEAANRILGPAFYLLYIFLVFFVLLNMFLAIINDTYSEVKAEIQAYKDEYRISDYILQRFRFGCREKPENVKKDSGMHDSAADGKITHDEIKSHLIQSNYSAGEIDLFLARYALDIDEVPLDEEETEHLLSELRKRTSSGRKDMSHGDALRSIASSESERVDKRITAMEVSLTTLIGQLDNILTKLPEIEDKEHN